METCRDSAFKGISEKQKYPSGCYHSEEVQLLACRDESILRFQLVGEVWFDFARNCGILGIQRWSLQLTHKSFILLTGDYVSARLRSPLVNTWAT